MGLAVVRSLDAPRRLATAQELEDYEQELVDQYLLAAVGAGMGDAAVGGDRAVIFEFIRFTGRPVWTARPADADRFLAHQRRELGRARLTVQKKAWALAHFFDFLVDAVSGRHPRADRARRRAGDRRVQPARAGGLRGAADPAVGCRGGGAVRRVARRGCRRRASSCPPPGTTWPPRCGGGPGCGSQETYMLDIRDWRRDLGEYGKIHVRFGKGSKGRGPKTRLVAGDQPGGGAAGLVDGRGAAPVRR